MPKKVKLWSVEFDPMYPVGNVLIILAQDKKTAMAIATETIKHTKPVGVKKIPMKDKSVVCYLSGEY